MLNEFLGVGSIDGAYWSLFVEMRFYALVAVVLFIGKIHQAQMFLILWIIASVALEILPISMLRSLLIVDYSAYFIAGATYFLIWSQGISAARVGIIIPTWSLALFQTINGLPSFEKFYKTNMSGYVVAGLVTAFFCVMLLVSLRRTGVIGRNRWLLAGVLTYPLYLLHQNIGFMVFNIAYPTVNPHLLLWSTITVVVGLAYAVHIFVERTVSLPMKNAINHSVRRVQHLRTRFVERVRASR